MSKVLSVVVPCYFEQECVPKFYEAMQAVAPQLKGIELEYWFVNDGSTDGTLFQMQKLQEQDPAHVHYVSFSRNFGKEAAMYCGLQRATGDYVTVMDADLQDPPDLLPKMFEYIDQGYDCAGTRRSDRSGEPPLRSFLSRQFYKLINKISETEIVDGARDFRLMTRRMVNAVLQMSERNRFSKGLFSWVGFKTMYIPYHNRERVAGTSSWNLRSLVQYSFEGIINFSTAPLDAAFTVGLVLSFLALLGIIFLIVRWIVLGPVAHTGHTALGMLILFAGGLNLEFTGVVGKYVGKVMGEVKQRPVYIVDQER
ncbi:MAG: glycosyltransferase family 2 protein [Olsenella sp.]|jgi:glycosyltransferase involved in cell wall biosynthesis|nr:glycosyltransferase family 2 protein [Olsenella sp.]MCI1289882.1 glycosyltransferase family 2 protein [Olsenella sp.]